MFGWWSFPLLLSASAYPLPHKVRNEADDEHDDDDRLVPHVPEDRHGLLRAIVRDVLTTTAGPRTTGRGSTAVAVGGASCVHFGLVLVVVVGGDERGARRVSGTGGGPAHRTRVFAAATCRVVKTLLGIRHIINDGYLRDRRFLRF